MKKKVVLWMSRDKDSWIQEFWTKKPVWNEGEFFGQNHLADGRLDGRLREITCDAVENGKITIKQGGLAKITIERQY